MNHNSIISPPITSVGAGDFVSSRFTLAQDWGTQSFNLAQDLIGNLSTFTVEPLGIESPTISGEFSLSLERPERPTMPGDVTLDAPELPTLPSFPEVSDPNIGSPPSDIGGAPTLNFGSKPVVARPTAPGAPPTTIDVEAYIPDRPDLQFPELPTLEELQLPDAPVIQDFEFEGVRPVNDLEVPDGFGIDGMQIDDYSSDLLDQVRDRVSTMLQGGTGLPPAIEQMIFDRSRAREDDGAERALMEVMDDWAARGFSLPSGLIDKRRERIRQENQSQSNTLNRELTVRVHEIEIENIRFAVQQGIALEDILGRLYLGVQQLKVQVATTVAQLALDVFRGRIELYNAEVNAYRVDAEVYRERIRAEMTKVELFRAELEAERLRGEVNQQKIDIYRAQLQGLDTLVSIYSNEMQAAQILASVNETRFRAYAAEIQAFTAQIEANASEFRAWATEVEGEMGKIRGYEAEARAFTARTQAFAAGAEARTIVPRFQIEKARAEADAFRAQVAGFQANVSAESARIQALTEKYRAKAAIYSSDAQVYSAEIGAEEAQRRVNFEEARGTAELGLRAQEVNIQQAINLSGQLLQALQGAAQAASQLAASSFSAVSAGASVSEQASGSNNWNESIALSWAKNARFEGAGSVTW